MTVWLLEAGGTSPHTLTTTGVFRKEREALSVFENLRRSAAKQAGHKIHRYTYEDGTHESVWGANRLRLRPVKPI